MKNLGNCKLVLDQIEKHPETWIQEKWHCGSSHCFAGWAQILSGNNANDDTVRRDARIFLGLSYIEAQYYFDSRRRLEELKTVLEDFYDQAGCKRYGYNRAGYDKAGYDHAGYDRAGYNRAGYDRDDLDINNNLKP